MINFHPLVSTMTLFFDTYKRWSTITMAKLYESDRTQFKIEFGRHIEKIRETQPHEYIRRMVRYITRSDHKVPCLIFDNTDHFTIEFQESVFQYARSIYESEFCIVLVPITDKTSWQLSKQGALQSFESEALFLPVPKAERIIERRIAFLLEKIEDDDTERRRSYFLNRGIRLQIDDIGKFATTLNRMFVESRDTARWISGLANSDIRRLLEITKDAIASPHLNLDYLLKATIAGTSDVVPEYKIKQAIIKRRYDIYPTGEHSFVQNVFAISLDPPTTPLLGVRILQFLRDAEAESSEEGGVNFVSVDSVHEHFIALGIPAQVTSVWLLSLLKTGLILNYDPSIVDINDTSRIEASPSGKIHLAWATLDTDYIQMMKDVTPLRDKIAYDEIVSTHSNYRIKWPHAIGTFISYLLTEDSQWCNVPEHPNFHGQASVVKRLDRIRRRVTGNPGTDIA